MLRARNNTIIAAPNFEVQSRMSSLSSAGETIETKEFGTVKVGSTVTYTNRPGENRFAWGTVRDVGPGAAWMKDRYRLDRGLTVGDVIGFDQSQYVDWHDNDERLMILPVDAALCRFNASEARPEPLGVYFMSVPDDEATRRFTLGRKSQAAGFILTNDRAKGEITVTDNPNSKVRYSAERVVAVGGGGMSIGDAGQQALGDSRAYCTTTADGKIVRVRVKEPIEVIPDPYAVGKLAVFGNTMSVDAWCNGTRYRFTNWDRVRALAET